MSPDVGAWEGEMVSLFSQEVVVSKREAEGKIPSKELTIISIPPGMSRSENNASNLTFFLCKL